MRSPPTSCTIPVPTRFRIPSASVMMREMRIPVFVESKYETGRRRMWRCTSTRMSVMARCAAMLTTCESANEVIAWMIVATPTAIASGKQQFDLLLREDVVDQVLRARREHEPREAIHQHQREADRERPPMRPHQRTRLGPGAGGVDLRFGGLLRGGSRSGHGLRQESRVSYRIVPELAVGCSGERVAVLATSFPARRRASRRRVVHVRRASRVAAPYLRRNRRLACA